MSLILDSICGNDIKKFSGDVKFLKELKSPWTMTITTEKLHRDQWIISLFNRFISDFCSVLKSEREPWYMVTKHMVNNCPFPAGVSFNVSISAKVKFHC